MGAIKLIRISRFIIDISIKTAWLANYEDPNENYVAL